jgi:hypothetical protein
VANSRRDQGAGGGKTQGVSGMLALMTVEKAQLFADHGGAPNV